MILRATYKGIQAVYKKVIYSKMRKEVKKDLYANIQRVKTMRDNTRQNISQLEKAPKGYPDIQVALDGVLDTFKKDLAEIEYELELCEIEYRDL